MPHDDNITMMPHDDNITMMPHDDNITMMPHDDNITMMPHDDNIYNDQIPRYMMKHHNKGNYMIRFALVCHIVGCSLRSPHI